MGKATAKNVAGKVMSFGDHLDELRLRLIFSIVGLVLLFVVFLLLGRSVLGFLTEPALDALASAGQPRSFLATNPIESFAAYLKVAGVMALVTGMPWLLIQLWLFVSPGLYEHERRFAYLLAPMSAALTVIGFLFLYKVLLPVSLYFLVTFGGALLTQQQITAEAPPGAVFPSAPVLAGDPPSPEVGQVWVNTAVGQLRVRISESETMGLRLLGTGLVAQEYRIGEYVNLVFWMGLVFAIAFQLPLVLMLLSWTGIVRAEDLTGYRRHVIFGCAVAGAVFTPQDPWSMILLGGALYLLFEFGIVLMRFMPAERVAGGVLTTRRTDANEGDE